MKPKEKAIEIYNKFYGIPLYIKTIKQCCYFVIDEVLESMRMDDEDSGTVSNANSKWVNYWAEVKEEIEKL